MSSLSVVHAARVVRAGRIALTRAALGAICVMAFPPFAPAARAANPESCAEPDAASARRLLEVVAVVSRGDITELRLYADSAFATPVRATNTDERAHRLSLIHI